MERCIGILSLLAADETGVTSDFRGDTFDSSKWWIDYECITSTQRAKKHLSDCDQTGGA